MYAARWCAIEAIRGSSRRGTRPWATRWSFIRASSWASASAMAPELDAVNALAAAGTTIVATADRVRSSSRRRAVDRMAAWSVGEATARKVTPVRRSGVGWSHPRSAPGGCRPDASRLDRITRTRPRAGPCGTMRPHRPSHPTQEDPLMSAIRRADVAWSGDLVTGSGTVSASTSGSFSDLPVTWAARTESSGGKTSPEELLAAAHASCFAMAFSAGLGRAGTPPERLSVSAEVTFDKTDAGWSVVSSALTVRGVVPGMSEADFVAAAEAAKDGCPISGAIAGNVDLSVDATLEA